jgi:hypothetical protein
MCYHLSIAMAVLASALHVYKLMLFLSVGKDITHKLYSLNEHLGAVASSEAASNALGRQPDHWRTMNRSLSVDAVHTGTRGHVRSLAWRAQQQRRTSATYSDSKLRDIAFFFACVA